MKPISVFNYSVRNSSGSTVDVYIDGAIVDAESQQILKDWFGDETSVSFKSIRNQIEKAEPKTINVHINSVGGVVTDAMAIHDYLIEKGKAGVTVNTYIKGLAASASTYIAMATENSYMSENSWFMIHNMSGGIWGDVNEIENYARMIRKFNNSARDFYSDRTGIRKEDVTRMMDAETWLTANEAKEKGFIKNVNGSEDFTNAISPANWPYSNLSVLNSYNSFTKNNTDMDIKKITDGVTASINTAFENLMNKLGIKKDENKDATNEFSTAITNALTEGLKPLENISETIANAVTEAVKNATKDFSVENITQLINNQVSEATKNLVKVEDLRKLEGDIANKSGKPASEPKDDPKDEDDDPESRRFKNKKDFFKVGNLVKN